MWVQCDTEIATDWHIYWGDLPRMGRPKRNNIRAEEYRCAWGCYYCRYSYSYNYCYSQMTVVRIVSSLFLFKTKCPFVPTCLCVSFTDCRWIPLAYAVPGSQEQKHLAREDGALLNDTIISKCLCSKTRVQVASDSDSHWAQPAYHCTLWLFCALWLCKSSSTNHSRNSKKEEQMASKVAGTAH